MAKPIPSQEVLRRLFDYDAETGNLIHKPREISEFASRWAYLLWNKRYPGSVAGSIRKNGYISVAIANVAFYAHRLIWMREYGFAPESIDHIDGNKTNNRIDNLRASNPSVNTKNRAISSNNTSGQMGVYWHDQTQKWCARIYDNKKSVGLGLYDNFEDAVKARREAEARYGYHPNHGRAA